MPATHILGREARDIAVKPKDHFRCGYRLWLDERMVYSCAYFHSDSDSLEDAQERKLGLICRKL